MTALTSRRAGIGTAPQTVARGLPALSGRQKAAVIVRLLLSEGIDVPLQALPDHLQAALTEQMGRMRSIDQDTMRAVVEDFCMQAGSIGLSFPGGIDGALKLLDGRISPSAANRLRRLAGESAKADPWDRIAGMEGERLLPALTEESLEVGAVILSKLPVPKAAALLSELPGDRARRLAHAVSLTEGTPPDCVRRIGLALIAQLEAQPLRAFETGPVDRMGAILNVSPASTRDDVLTGLADEDTGFADRVRKAIFTFADIPARIEGRDIAKVTRGVPQPVLLTALASAEGADAAAAEFILASLSQRMAASLREEMAGIGKIRARDAEAAQTAVVTAIRDLEASGEITLKADGADED